MKGVSSELSRGGKEKKGEANNRIEKVISRGRNDLKSKHLSRKGKKKREGRIATAKINLTYIMGAVHKEKQNFNVGGGEKNVPVIWKDILFLPYGRKKEETWDAGLD